MTAAMRVGIQADDLTGACDTGVAFAARGLETLVLLPDAPMPSPAPEVLVLDTESRALPPAEARARARSAAARLAAHAPAVLYKKVDSTLRGAVAGEIAGVLAGAGRAHAILAPAFPAQRRAVVDGVLRIDGRPAEATAVARDPAFPPTGGSVLALFGPEGPGPAGVVPLATLRRGTAAVAARLERGAAIPLGAVVCDAETEEDLGVLAGAAVRGGALLAGSAGLAAALAAGMPAGRPAPPAAARRPLLVVAGSAHPATRAQIERLARRGVPGRWLGDDPASAPRGERLPDAGDRFLAARAGAGAEDTRGPAEIARRLAAATRAHLDAVREAPGAAVAGTLLLTGGETAAAVCRALEATGVRLTAELEPGLPLGALLDGPFAGLPVITKGGGFGDPEMLVRVREMLGS